MANNASKIDQKQIAARPGYPAKTSLIRLGLRPQPKMLFARYSAFRITRAKKLKVV